MRCATCDAEIDNQTLGGLCPVCLLDAALPKEAEEGTDGFRYDLIEEIARGGMGVVYRAVQHGSQRQVALKMVLADQATTPGVMERFRAEAEAVASLDDPHILPIYEIGECEGRPFYSMKFANGGTLRDRAADFAEPRSAARLIATIARAVHHAHGRGILHRDLKPGNVLLDGQERKPYVSDFGLARWIGRESRLTLAQGALGTPHYIAPEQAVGSSSKLTPAADVYSLGAILYELLVAQPPFVADTPLETLRLSRETEPRSLRSVKPTLPRDLEVICLKCLAKDPSARYQTALALAQDLERWLEGQTILARPANVAERAWRWTKRNRIVTALSVALAAALLTMVIAWFFLQRPPPRANPSDAPAKSIAVLPFANLSDEQNVSFANGVQDEILTHLAKIADLKVISRTSVMSYVSGAPRNMREIGRQLGVAHLLEGSVQREGNRVRVNAQLIDARSDSHLWAQTYDRDLADVFAIQTEIARAISDQLQAKLSPAEKAAIETAATSDLEAFDLYTRGKALIEDALNSQTPKEDLLRGIDFLTQAVGRDSAFHLAYCELAHAHDLLYILGKDHTPSRLALGQAAVDAAVRLAPDAGETHLAVASHLYFKLEYDRAREELALARRTLPNNARTFELTGYINRRQGRWAESTRDFEHALELDPNNIVFLQQLATTHQALHAYSKAAGLLDRVLTLRPDDFDTKISRALIEMAWRADTRPLHALIEERLKEDPSAAKKLAEARLLLALRERDLVAMEEALAALGDSTSAGAVQLSPGFYKGLLARMKGDPAAAQAAFTAARIAQERLVQTQPEYGPAISVLGMIDAGLGRKEDALREGRRAVELLPLAKDAINGVQMIANLAMIAAWIGENDLAIEQLRIATQLPGGPPYGALKLGPLFDPLRGDPRFEKIVVSLKPTSTSSAPAAPDKSIAVLPFDNLSRDPESAFFTQGIQDEILVRLGKIGELKVISRTSTERFTSSPKNLSAIAQQLGVAHVLEGSVQKIGDSVRVNVQLINARTDDHLWAETYDRKLTDVFVVETEIAKAVAEKLHAKLTGREQNAVAARRTENPAAHQLYIKGRFFWNKRTAADLKKAIDYLDQAVAADPKYALAYAGLADAYLLWPFYGAGTPQDSYPKAKAAAVKALALDDTLAEAHIAHAEAIRLCDLDLAGAEIEFRRGLELDPNYATGHHWFGNGVLTGLGRFDEAIAELKRAVELDPLSLIINADLGTAYTFARRYDEAIEQYKRTLEMDGGFYYAHWGMAVALELKGSFDEAQLEFAKARQLNDDPWVIALQAHAYHSAGKKAEARKLVDELKELAKTRYVSRWALTTAHLAVEEYDQAITALEKSFADRDGNALTFINVDPYFDPLRNDPRLQAIAERVAPRSTPISSNAPEKSIAVLPFLDLSQAKDQEYFCDGISEQILDSLAKVPGLQVAARTSSFSLKGTKLGTKEIAGKLGVKHLLEGSLRRDGNRIRVTAQLVNAPTGFHLWSDTFERELQGVFGVQDEITKAITTALKLKLAVGSQAATQNTEAYDLYLQGIFFSNKSTEEGLRKSLELFQRAIEKDPRSAKPWVGIAKTWNWLADAYVRPLEAYPKMKAAAEKAVALDPNDGEAHIWMGEAKRILDWDLSGFKAELERALQLEPNSATAHVFLGLYEATQGNNATANAHVREGLRLDPLSPVISHFAALCLMFAGYTDQALEEGKRTLELDPNFFYGSPILANVYREVGRFPEAIALFEKAQQATGQPQPGLAITYAVTGRQKEARRILGELLKIAETRYIAAEEIASVYAALGEKEQAFKWLERACDDHGGAIHLIPIRPIFNALHSDPRFRRIVQRIGLGPRLAAEDAPERSIAVLPFIDLSEKKDQEFFCDGISEAILESLGQVRDLQVAARTSSFSFKGTNLGVKEIAAKLGVRHVLEGSLRREGNRIRVTVQLIKASDGFHLWSQTYERELQGVFAVQDEITKAVTSALKLKLVESRPARTENAEAYELYLQGVFFSNKSTEEGLRKSLEFFQRSLEKDPNSARTYAGIAKAWNWLGDAYVKPMDAFPQMKAAALKAVELDEHLADGHIWLGNAKRILDWDVRGCWTELDRALELDPNSAAARSIRTLGQLCVGDKKAALADIKASIRLDPLSPIVSNFAAVAYLCAGEVDEAIAEAKRLMQLDPNYIYESPILGQAYFEKGMYPEAIAIFERAQQLTGAPQPGLAITYARIGRQAEARQILVALKKVAATKHIPAQEIAAVHVALGEKDEAFKWLERGYAEHGGAFHGIAIRPDLRELHSDPRFHDILRRIGLNPDVLF